MRWRSEGRIGAYCRMARILEDLLEESKVKGWAAGQGTMAEVQVDAALLGWTEVPTRRGGPALTTLRPVDQADAKPNSLSARYGKGAQPLHTDGAHLPDPPDVVILVCRTTSTTPTRLWHGQRYGHPMTILPECVDHGVFLISSGNDSFFATARAAHRLRFDPGCMVPCDARARETVQYFAEVEKYADEYIWSEPGSVLLIDNRRVLHARAPAVQEPQREIQRISYRLKRETS